MAVAASKAKSLALGLITKNNWSFAELKRVETLWGPHGYHRILYRTLLLSLFEKSS